MFKKIALRAIRFYQKNLSPLKGFSCAYRVHAHGPSCSAFGHSAIEKHGVLKGLYLLRRRFDKCAYAHHQHKPTHAITSHTPRIRNPILGYQAGFVDGCDAGDCDVGSCDVGSCDMPSPDFCDLAEIGCNCMPNNSCMGATTGGGTGVSREENRKLSRQKRREKPDGPDAGAVEPSGTMD